VFANGVIFTYLYFRYIVSNYGKFLKYWMKIFLKNVRTRFNIKR